MLPPGPDTFLGTAGPQVIPLFQTEKDVLELVHPGVGKEEGRIVSRDQVGTFNNRVASFLKKVEKSRPDFLACHENL
jgi:hypothetical protein